MDEIQFMTTTVVNSLLRFVIQIIQSLYKGCRILARGEIKEKMRYHKYKHKPGGYIRKRNRLGGFSTIQSKNFAPIGGCLGCLIPCLSVPMIILWLFIVLL